MTSNQDGCFGKKTAMVLGGALLAAVALFSALAALDHRHRALLERLDDLPSQPGK